MLLAGGSGTRFWPESRKRKPKQFLALAGKRPLLVESWRRVRKLAPPSRIWVVAPAALADSIRELLPQLRPDRLVIEPSPRDTAPAIALACASLAAVDPEAVVGIFPTDHVVRDVDAFKAAVERAAGAAAAGDLCCLGIKPDRPATGFGYLKCKGSVRAKGPIEVDRFVEKPDLAKAKRFLKTGTYLWNAGMFVWRATRFLDELDRTAPEIRTAVERMLAGKAKAWDKATKLSVDYAVMERARGVKVVPLDAGWDDVGSWQAAAALLEEAGLLDRSPVLVGSEGTAVFGAEKLVAVVGLPDVSIVETPDALLVVRNDQSERVRDVVKELEKRGRRDLL
ncbi:hypothetical protein ABI59_04770 [Acidobacteria bacterium Mor1]|nr:hypothetical protein ABI59_04770 [Acidobacteria bacterium Mor1]